MSSTKLIFNTSLISCFHSHSFTTSYTSAMAQDQPRRPFVPYNLPHWWSRSSWQMSYSIHWCSGSYLGVRGSVVHLHTLFHCVCSISVFTTTSLCVYVCGGHSAPLHQAYSCKSSTLLKITFLIFLFLLYQCMQNLIQWNVAESKSNCRSN